ncbi:MAG TPA: hypothetical protein VFV10_15985 [Gammaproteobacteria bacterium]|nr:hypothetical protein [Gammaproteobacteria bacterium]
MTDASPKNRSPSVHWSRRSLAVWHDAARGTMRIRIELPIEAGEIIARALDRAIAEKDAATGPELEASRSAQQADAPVALARAYRPSTATTGHGKHDDPVPSVPDITKS